MFILARRSGTTSSGNWSKRVRIAALGAFAITAAICKAASSTQDTSQPIWPTQEWQLSTPEEEGMDSKELAELVDWGILSFDSLLLARHGKIVVEAYYAPYAVGLPHSINSCTKAVIELGLEEAPYGSFYEMRRSSDWVKFILDRPMWSAPGATFNYDSGNTHLLSAILTKITGMSALEYAKTKLFGPLGIKDVSWAQDPKNISIGGFGLWLQPRDMAKIGYLYLRNGVWEGKQLLPSVWIDKVNHATIDTYQGPGLRYSNCFWAFPEKPVYLAQGYQGQVIMVFPDLEIVAVRTGHGDFGLSEFANRISGSVKSDKALPSSQADAKLLANRIRDVATEKPTQVSPVSKMAASISGKVYWFPPNPINVRSMSLRLTDPQPSYDAELYAIDTTKPAPRFAGPIGLDGRYETGKPTYIRSLGIRAVNAAKGTWQDDHTFVMNRLILGEGHSAQQWSFTFDGDKLNLRVTLFDGNEVSIDGNTSG